VYRRLNLELPASDAERPIVLIGGRNGSGKTSLLGAIIYCLFGRFAVRDFFANDAALGKRDAYSRAMEAAFHRPARDRGETVMSVSLEFDTSDGPVRVERRWHFNEAGRFIDEDEEITILVGPEFDILAVPPDATPASYYQEEITRRLVAPSLAPFVFFDGEQVGRLSSHKMAGQLKVGLDGLVGAPYLRQLIADLRDYARDRGRAASTVRTGDDHAAEAEIAALEQRESEVMNRLSAAESDIEQHRSRRDWILGELGRLTGGTFASLHELLEEHRRVETQEARIRAALAAFAADELPLHLTGRRLRAMLSQRLAKEDHSGAGLGSEAEREAALERFLSEFNAEPPPLPIEIRKNVEARLRLVWDRWQSPPEVTGDVRHAYLGGRPRQALRARLDQPDSKLRGRADELLTELARCEALKNELSKRIDQQRGYSTVWQELQDELSAISGILVEEELLHRELNQELGQTRSALEPRRSALRARHERLSEAQPALGRAARAELLAELVEQVVDYAAAEYAALLSSAVTRTYRDLAHKDLIHRIEISGDGVLRVTDRGGRAIENLDASAGERHVFAIALLAAVAELGGGPFPVVMDTPLGRLDQEHRENILGYCAARRSQTLLLSHEEEVGGRYLDQISDRIAARYMIEHHPGVDGPGESILVDGYFMTARIS
jgi:DNA sulfur modification protein DndD